MQLHAIDADVLEVMQEASQLVYRSERRESEANVVSPEHQQSGSVEEGDAQVSSHQNENTAHADPNQHSSREGSHELTPVSRALKP